MKAMFLETQIKDVETSGPITGFGSKAKARVTIDLYTSDDKNMANLKCIYAEGKNVTLILAEK